MGMHVDIRRSDGRVHNAVISEVRKGSQTVTVEWFENVGTILYHCKCCMKYYFV